MKIVFATENPGKLKEVQMLAEPFGYQVLSPSQAGFVPIKVIEDGATYEENASLKVEAYRTQAGAENFVICGDDSGIEIRALGGEPGLHSRRWLGYDMMDQEICTYALGRMHNVKDRSAEFKSVLAYSLYGAPVLYTRGAMKGWVTETAFADAPRQEGFPFRRLFMVNAGNVEIPLYKFETLALDERVPSHREEAFLSLFQKLSGASSKK